MYARGDMIIFSEPGEYVFESKYNQDADCPYQNYESVKKELYEALKIGYVFAKDTPYSFYDGFYDDEAFLKDPNIEFCFLIRNPHASIISYHKVFQDEDFSGLQWIFEWQVYELHYKLFKKIAKLRGKKPIVISSEELTTNPEKILKNFCQTLKIPFKQTMLRWPVLVDNFEPSEWHDYNNPEIMQKWYKNVLSSTQFSSCQRDYDVDEHGKPTFLELKESERVAVKEVYKNQMKFYTKLMNQNMMDLI